MVKGSIQSPKFLKFNPSCYSKLLRIQSTFQNFYLTSKNHRSLGFKPKRISCFKQPWITEIENWTPDPNIFRNKFKSKWQNRNFERSVPVPISITKVCIMNPYRNPKILENQSKSQFESKIFGKNIQVPISIKNLKKLVFILITILKFWRINQRPNLNNLIEFSAGENLR